MTASLWNLTLLCITLASGGCSAFLGTDAALRRPHQNNNIFLLHASSSPTKEAATTRSQPRLGIAQELLNLALKSPLWTYVLVPQARASIVKTAESNGIQWNDAKQWLNKQITIQDYSDVSYPEYYKQSFHAYTDGNLSYDAAVEQELASRAVGARNFPQFGECGEDVFRGAFDKALSELGATICDSNESTTEKVIVDMGCGTGTSTRRLAKQYPEVDRLIGIDLSPYFVDVGNTLLKIGPDAIAAENGEQGGWITAITSDERIQLQQGDMGNTGLPSNFASVVNLSLVIHELPTSVAKQVIQEAYRILQPGGQLWISEMDFESPAYAAQRENALLFSLLRATEPYLDEYADGLEDLREFIVNTFDTTKIAAATGRHYALVAQKEGIDGVARNSLEDYRFKEDGSYAVEDTHLKPWESQSSSEKINA